MTQKQAIIKAVTNFDVDRLDVILDQESYMKVSKALFLKMLRKQFYYLKTDGSDKFIRVIPGTCNKCFKGCGGYTFLTQNQRTLDLLFKEEDEFVKDLFLCSDFNTHEELEKDDIYFYFYDDEQLDYNPSKEERDLQNRVERILSDFKKLENTIVEIAAFDDWLSESYEISNLENPFTRFKFLADYRHLYKSVVSVYDLVKHHDFAQNAMCHFNSIDLANESEVLDWLLQYEDSELCWNDDFILTEHWQDTNFIVFNNYKYEEGVKINYYENIVIDVTRYSSSLAFGKHYSDLHQKYNKKYWPTDEMFDKYGGFSGGLMDFLFAWGVFPELLQKFNFKDLEVVNID